VHAAAGGTQRAVDGGLAKAHCRQESWHLPSPWVDPPIMKTVRGPHRATYS
jgi:hypothetical protein